MKLPSDSRRARLAWSVIAAGIAGVMLFGWAAACAHTGFIQKYTMPELCAEIFKTPLNELDGHVQMRRWSDRLFLLHLIALPVVLWPLCLVAWRSKRGRIMAALVAWLAPCWWVAVAPEMLLGATLMIPAALVGSIDGEDLESGALIFAGAALWWWFMLVVTVLTIARKDPPRAECASCGYSTVGLRSNVCPECGSAITLAVGGAPP